MASAKFEPTVTWAVVPWLDGSHEVYPDLPPFQIGWEARMIEGDRMWTGIDRSPMRAVKLAAKARRRQLEHERKERRRNARWDTAKPVPKSPTRRRAAQ